MKDKSKKIKIARNIFIGLTIWQGILIYCSIEQGANIFVELYKLSKLSISTAISYGIGFFIWFLGGLIYYILTCVINKK